MTIPMLRRLRDWLRRRVTDAASLRPTTPALPKGLRIYAIGDIHGESGLLDSLTRGIEADLAADPPAAARAVFLGDYIDRGPATRDVVERLAAARFPLPFEALRGNHEDMLLQALDAPDAMARWCDTGGLETLRSYGLTIGKPPRGKALDTLRHALAEALPPSHLDFLRATRLSLTIGDYFFVHAGARPGVELDRQDPHDLMWIRRECYDSSHDFGKVLVHGHTPRKKPENVAKRINVDTGAFKWGVLTAVVLEGDRRRFIATRT